MDKGELTKRQEWGVIRDWHQLGLEACMERLQIGIEYWNLLLAYANASGDYEKVAEIAVDAIEALDNEWEFHRDYFMVTGKWHKPNIAIGNSGIVGEHVYEDAFATAISNGFIMDYVETDGTMTPRMGMSFILRDMMISNTLIQGSFQILAFAEPHEISLSYVRPGTAEVVSSDIEQIGDAFMRAESLLALYIDGLHTSFFQQPDKKQQAFFESIIEMVEQTLPDQSSLDGLVARPIITNRMYFKQDGRLVALKLPQGEFVEIGGKVMGVTILDHFDHKPGKPLCDHEDLIDAGAKLCLIVQPEQWPALNGEIITNNDLVIPLAYIQNIQLHLV